MKYLIVRLRMQEQHRECDSKSTESELVSNVNQTESKCDQKKNLSPMHLSQRKIRRKTRTRILNPHKDINKKNDVECFVCKKKRVIMQGNAAKERAMKLSNKPILLRKTVAMVIKVNLVSGGRDWWVDTGATKHICRDRSAFVSYEQVRDSQSSTWATPL